MRYKFIPFRLQWGLHLDEITHHSLRLYAVHYFCVPFVKVLLLLTSKIELHGSLRAVTLCIGVICRIKIVSSWSCSENKSRWLRPWSQNWVDGVEWRGEKGQQCGQSRRFPLQKLRLFLPVEYQRMTTRLWVAKDRWEKVDNFLFYGSLLLMY